MDWRLWAGVVSALFLAVSAAAETKKPEPWPEFTFKRVKPPAPGTQSRITVTIEPVATITIPDHTDAPPDPEPSFQPSGYDWFWAAVSPKLGTSGPQRMIDAIANLSNGPSGSPVAAPPLDTLAAISRSYGMEILRSTIGTRVSPALALAVISVESGGNAGAVSGAGAQGLMQLIPATADRFGVTDAYDPAENIGGGVAYLNWLIEEFDGDALMALAGYNAGENAVKRHGGIPPYAETRAYVPKVIAAWQVARALCQTPPELVTDGCVFTLTGG